MATETVQAGASVPLDDPRRRAIAHRAGCQVEALAECLSGAASRGDEGIEDLVLAVAARLRQLAGIVMSASIDEGESIGAMEARLRHG